MTLRLARAMMTLAVHSLDGRRDWAQAMRGEFAEAAADGRALSFAAGCLTTAWGQLPRHPAGRFTLASNVLAIGFMIPAAAVMITGLFGEFPFLSPWALEQTTPSDGVAMQLFAAWRAATLPLAALVLGQGIGHVLIAWALLERDWRRVMVLAKLNASAALTLVAVTATMFLDDAGALILAGVLAIELAAVAALAWWHMDGACSVATA